MKKLLAAFFAALLSFLSFSGCAAAPADNARLRIVCTVFPQYDFLRELTAGVDGVSLTLLLRAGQESHDYDPSSRDIAAIHTCDLFVSVGGESDHWVEEVLRSVDTAHKRIFYLLDSVTPLAEEHSEHDHHHHGGTEYDEHVWTAPQNAIKICHALTEELCTLDSDNAARYLENNAVYTARLQALDDTLREVVKNGARREIVVADRFPFLYFCKAYGLSWHAAFAGCAASVEPSSVTVQHLIDTVKEQRLPLVFKCELSAGQVAQTVADNTGCGIATLFACHNLSKTDFDNGETYLSLMYKNAAALREALS